MDGIVDNPTDPPEGCSRLYINPDDYLQCQSFCHGMADCHAFTFMSNDHDDVAWKGECLACSEEVVGDNRVANEWARSGVRTMCQGNGELV